MIDAADSIRGTATSTAHENKQPVPEGLRNGLGCLVTSERLVSKMGRDVACFVHLAIRAFMLYCRRAIAHAQNFVRHHPWLDEVFRVLDGHLVNNFIALPRQLLND